MDKTAGLKIERRSFCRICATHCGMVLTLDEQERLVSIRPDKEDQMTQGFACFKGLQAVEQHDPANRIRHTLKRQLDGSFARIDVEQALDEVAEKLQCILDRDGPEAVGGYRGTGSGHNACGCFIMDSLMGAIGTNKIFSATTIDQPAKCLTPDRMGYWGAGMHLTEGSDVILMMGQNPLVSFNPTFAGINPLKAMREYRARGVKILVIDPRTTETAKFADIHLRPLPGQDATILAGMIREILKNGWEDREFCDRYIQGLDDIRARVEPFTPDYVANCAQIDKDQFLELIRTFATIKRGKAASGTGSNMGPHSNLVEHLVHCLNYILGRVIREGERIANPGGLMPRYPRLCQVMPPRRSFESGYKWRLGDYGSVQVTVPEAPTGLLADEILQPGPGQVKAFFVHGGNPAVIVPDQLKVVRAFRSLELMVVVDPYMTPTAKLAHYVFPTHLQYERPDLPCWQSEVYYYHVPYTRYTPAIAKPDASLSVSADEYIFWGLIKRLGKTMNFLGTDMDMSRPPTTDELLDVVAKRAGTSIEELRPHELGVIRDGEPQFADPGSGDERLVFNPPEVLQELEELAREDSLRDIIVHDGTKATHLLTVRRQRNMYNSINRMLPNTHRRIPHNAAFLHPDDIAQLGIKSGDPVHISSRTTSVEILCQADETMRRGVVSMTHGYGDLPELNNYRHTGVAVNALLSTDFDRQTINAMPRMTAVPVAVTAAPLRNSDVLDQERPGILVDGTREAAVAEPHGEGQDPLRS
jgi:anaerobic selenocysteine-containing dehydrogenase